MSTAGKEKKEFQTSLGMFNLFKGLGILVVIFYHSMPVFSISLLEGKMNIFSIFAGFVFLIFGSSVMPAFFVVSGYGFRPMKAKGIKKKIRQILVPYIVMAITTVIMHFVFHFGAFHYLKGTIKESIKVIIGFILALPANLEVKGYLFYSCGIGWFLITLLLDICLLNILVKINPNKTWISVLICVVIGLVLCRFQIIVFCLSQIFVGVFFLYEGYIVRKNKLLLKEWNWKWTCLFILSIAITALAAIYGGNVDNIADGRWIFSIVSVVSDGILAFFILYLFARAKDFDSKAINIIKRIGNSSLIIFCIHSIEMKSIPWYLFAEKWSGNSYVGFILLIIARSITIYILYCAFLLIYKNIWLRIKKGK